jgi:MSHA biogenesis protein MshK
MNQMHCLLRAVCVLWAVCAAVAAGAEALVDPMRPAMASGNGGTREIVVARVTAVFNAGERRVAVLDGRLVKAGDRVGDLVVNEILADGVRYTRGGRVETARLPKQAADVRRKSQE